MAAEHQNLPPETEAPTAAQSRIDEFKHQSSLPQMSLMAELWLFLQETRKWWLIPILLAIVFVGALVVLSSSAAAPFLYPLF